LTVHVSGQLPEEVIRGRRWLIIVLGLFASAVEPLTRDVIEVGDGDEELQIRCPLRAGEQEAGDDSGAFQQIREALIEARVVDHENQCVPMLVSDELLGDLPGWVTYDSNAGQVDDIYVPDDLVV
jgi:hypothetical protein